MSHREDASIALPAHLLEMGKTESYAYYHGKPKEAGDRVRMIIL